MTTNLDSHYLAIEIERARLPKQAERGWSIEQAIVAQRGPIGPSPVRSRIGRLIVALGQRVEGMPVVARPMTDPGHAH